MSWLQEMLPKRLFGCCLIACFLGIMGCNQRIQTPELEYSQSEVDLIRQQIDATDW